MKYELIKEYPKSPKLGKIEDSNNGAITGWQGTLFYNAHPEFWKKVEELDYEILTVNPSKENTTNTNKEATITWKVCNKDLRYWDIHSVKRLSDGEVFTIGDKISFGHNYNEVITKMSLADSNSNIKKGIWIHYEGGSCHIDIAVKLKTPLFTTEDCVDIFEGDDFFVIETQFDKYRLHKTIGGHFTKERSTRLRFYSKEKAEEYVLLNKPMLSLQDLLNVWGISKEYEAYKTSPLFHSFLELAKSKL